MNTFFRILVLHPIALICQAFIGFSVIWTITESLTHFFGWTLLKDYRWFVISILLGFAYGIYHLWRPSKIVITIPISDVTIVVEFGDIFKCDGISAIPVNEYFDSELGKPVSPKSLHGIFIQRCFGGHPDAFDRQVDSQLARADFTNVPKEFGKTRKYPIGTSVMVEAGEREYLLFAFTHTDPATCKARADVPLMFKALTGLWQTARVELNGNSLNLPLVGSGLSGVGLPARDLINIAILSFIDETKRQVVTKKMKIVLTSDRFDEVDLREIKTSWEGK